MDLFIRSLHLRIRLVVSVSVTFAQREIFTVARYTNNSNRFGPNKANRMPYRALAAKESPGQRLVQHSDTRRIRLV